MAHLVKNDKGFLVVKCRTVELMTLERGVMSICDYCNRATLDGYICCVLGHRYYCEDCYKRWLEKAEHYEEDIPYETGVYAYYHSGFVRNELWEDNDKDVK